MWWYLQTACTIGAEGKHTALCWLGTWLPSSHLSPLLSVQEVHDLLSDYELKYCFVDKYKGTGE